MKVLVTDAGFKHSLAAIRSLGRRGIEVIAVSSNKYSLSFHSIYCKKKFICSDFSDELLFVSDLLDIIKKEKPDVLLPIGFNSFMAISKYQHILKPYVKIPIANYESMQIASNKNKTTKFAIKNKIPVPKTIFPNSIEDAERHLNSIKYPAVIKAVEESGSVRYANNEDEFKVIYSEVCVSHPNQIISGKFPQIQEYIPGDGYGFFALFNHGKPLAIFAHKRLHEYPPTGGPSTMAQSISDPELNRIGLKVLGDLNWHGVAMVEFKKDTRDNTFKLIEINPKFWGSLDLAITSGVDFPYLAVKMCMGEEIKSIFEYNNNSKFRWISSDFLYSVANHSLKEYLLNFSNNDICDDLDFRDIKPVLIQCLSTILTLLIRNKKRNLRYPHGKPDLVDDF